MPYEQGGRLPGETASKLGHLALVQSEWVRSLISDFEEPSSKRKPRQDTPWAKFERPAQPLSRVWAVDGSFVSVRAERGVGREVAFVKTALLSLDRTRLATVDKEQPHPLLLQDILADS